MVKDTRAASGFGDLRALNQPYPLAVRARDDGVPESLKVRGRWATVEAVVDRWRIDDEWWREQPVSRMYYGCVADHGLAVTVFQDLITCQWYLQRM